MDRTALLLVALLPLVMATAAPATIAFSGYTWHVKEGAWGPGPNEWRRDNVFVDEGGALHLRIAPDGLGWTCAEVWTTERFGFGTYAFEVRGVLAALDVHAVLGLFTYGPPDAGPDGTNEIDVELARWGDALAPQGQNVVWPALPGPDPVVDRFAIPLATTRASFAFRWEPQGVAFASVAKRPLLGPTPIGAWAFAPSDPQALVPQAPAPVHLNLWLFEGRDPVAPVEVVIDRFAFTP